MTFTIHKKDPNSRARYGTIHTAHGTIETPAFVVVGTHAEVRCLTPEDLEKTKTQVIISNTYHLWQTLGDRLETYKGVHKAMGWDKPIMTDSGGFQVFSLGFAREHGVNKIYNTAPEGTPNLSGESSSSKFRSSPVESKDICFQPQKNLVRITDEGAYFTTEKGEQFLGPKKSIQIQEKLGADIIFTFDECTSPLNDYEYTKKSMERTHKWAKICLEVKNKKDQLMYGISQGGEYEDLREESAKYIASLPFDGFGIGGSLRKSRDHKLDVLDQTIPFLPEKKPRHLLGMGKIEDIFDGVERGVDTFDCVIPTREARHGRVWIRGGFIDIKKSANKNNTDPLMKGCKCETCKNSTTRQQVHELFKEKDKNAARLTTIHNVFFFNNLMTEIREAIKENNLKKLKNEYLPT